MNMKVLNRKKTLAIAGLVGVGVVTASLGTISYFSDTDTKTNTFTVGNVDIELLESQLHRVNAGIANGRTSTSPLWTPDQTMAGTEANTPDVANYNWNGQYFSDDQIREDAAHYFDDGGYYHTNADQMLPGSNVRKMPYIDNIGTTDAYVRTRVLIPVSLFSVIDNGPSYWTSSVVGEGDTDVMYSGAVSYYYAHNYDMTGYETVSRNNVDYYEFDFTYKQPLAAGAMTFWNPWGNIAINKNATSDQLAGVDSFDVIVEADAIQATGFVDATAAFTAFDAQ